jgi:hypothetical protein
MNSSQSSQDLWDRLEAAEERLVRAARAMVRILFRRWKVIALMTLIGTAAGFVVSKLQKPIYYARARIEEQPRGCGPINGYPTQPSSWLDLLIPGR